MGQSSVLDCETPSQTLSRHFRLLGRLSAIKKAIFAIHLFKCSSDFKLSTFSEVFFTIRLRIKARSQLTIRLRFKARSQLDTSSAILYFSIH